MLIAWEVLLPLCGVFGILAIFNTGTDSSKLMTFLATGFFATFLPGLIFLVLQQQHVTDVFVRECKAHHGVIYGAAKNHTCFQTKPVKVKL